MRIHKYRGKRIDNGEWAYGYYFEISKRGFIVWKHATIHCIASISDIVLDNHHDFVEVDPETVGQFTGIHDKNGKEIYGGDILNFKADKRSPSGGQYCGTYGFHPENAKTVEWDKDCWVLGSFRLSTELKMYEVIGDIHDNPELLEADNGQ